MTTTAPNPITRRTALRAYPGWEVRAYADGTYDAAALYGHGLSPVMDSFREAVAHVREEERLMREQQAAEIEAERRNEEALYGPTEAMLLDYEEERRREAWTAPEWRY